MYKEIIGYKLKEVCEQYQEAVKMIGDFSNLTMLETYRRDAQQFLSKWDTIVNKLQSAKVLDLWFDPVYQDKFKIGDWVIAFIGKTQYIGKLKSFNTFKNICELSHRACLFHDVKNYIFYDSGTFEYPTRLATNEEILDHLRKEFINRTGINIGSSVTIKNDVEEGEYVIGGCTGWKKTYNWDGHYQVKAFVIKDGKFCIATWSHYVITEAIELIKSPNIIISTSEGTFNAQYYEEYVQFGCAKIDKNLFIDLFKYTTTTVGNKSIETVTIGKGTFTKDQINKIAKHYLK